MLEIKSSVIAYFLGKKLYGHDMDIVSVSPITNPASNSLLFAKKYSDRLCSDLNKLNNVLVIANTEFEGRLTGSYILSENPRLDFAKVVQQYFVEEKQSEICSTAIISRSAKIGRNVSVGHYTVIGDNVKIDDNTVIGDHVVIMDNCIIGSHCKIKANSVIGEEGFGFEFEDDGQPVKIPHLGRVVIGDHVSIGALNVVARGTLGDTVICNHVKTDDHVFIAHNVRIDEHSVIIAGSEISGSVHIGKNVWIAPQATIINQVSIGDNATVGIGAVVTKSVDANVIVTGNPAKVFRRKNV